MSLSFANLFTLASRTAAASATHRLSRSSIAATLGAGTLALCGLGTAFAQDNAAAPAPAAASAPTASVVAKPPVQNSLMDGALFYQILVAEVQSNAGDAGSAYQLYLESARRHQISQLYQRAVEIALRGRAGEQALTAAKAWRQAMPQSKEASEYTAQILLALGRTSDLAAPLRTLIQLTPTPQQPQVLASLPRTVARLNDKRAAAQVIDEATQPWRQQPLELAEGWSASAEGWMQAKEYDKSMAALEKAAALKPSLPNPGLIAIDLMSLDPRAEQFVKQQLARPDAPSLVRLAYGRKLAGTQRYAESAEQLEQLLATQPDQMGTWVTLAAVRLELKQLDKAEAALQPVLKYTPGSNQAATTNAPAPDANDIEQAYLLMSQIAEQRNQLAQSSTWLDRADPKHERINIQAQRARLLVKQGKIADARKLIRELPEAEPRDAVMKIQAEAQLLRDARQWEEAYKVLDEATKRFPEDSDLLYDQAMLGERLNKFTEMEAQLRKVMEMTPDNPNAFNALGYSLADRGVRLDEARTLIKKALELRPGDAFITDSLGWLEFRAGNGAEALRILNEAYQSRPDPEIAAHLGEVLWSQGKQDQARQLWLDSAKREPDNDTLKETLTRFKIKP
ncbi:MAG: tetratricopeptide repeat protein [Aquabacterium sp.]|uniref:tetratricopeptide repeat protein n=1 Tax=Aquabacterium sp. TaxID=1872578 RepID=UPI0025C581B0|nr:tetratricopeptide repeat protein [Aquabacterium sp.]MBI3382675.1 tetratricopeptide repeat protein [Aquabacterium sp.]